jgi:DNA-binding LytR/AlgR family response regulator
MDRPEVAATAIIAEDERPLADELAHQLSTLWPELAIVATVHDGLAALRAVERHAPRIAFLDIHMPQLSGLEVARRIAGRCHVVFLTAFDRHAVEAFEAGAVDYMLKPLGPARLLTTLDRLRERLAQAPRDFAGLVPAAGGAEAEGPPLQWLNVPVGAAVRLVTVDEVLYFRSDSKYTLVVTADSESLIRKTIRELADELDPTCFWQIHRSVIVNLAAIDSVVHTDSRTLVVRLKGRSETLPVAESHHRLFRSM